MKAKPAIARMDEVLIPLGFYRKKTIWRRSVGSFIAVLDVQVSKSGDRVTINAGVFDAEVYELCWGKPRPSVIDVPNCTVNARVGELIDNKDLWWPVDGERTPDAAAESLTAYVLPFLERMCSRVEMERFLIDSGVMKKKYPLPIIQLAVLKYLRGDKLGACGMLAELGRTALGAWRTGATEVAHRLRCENAG